MISLQNTRVNKKSPINDGFCFYARLVLSSNRGRKNTAYFRDIFRDSERAGRR